MFKVKSQFAGQLLEGTVLGRGGAPLPAVEPSKWMELRRINPEVARYLNAGDRSGWGGTIVRR